MTARNLLSLLVLLLCVFAGAAADPTRHAHKPVEIVVEGVVFCQNCRRIGSWSLTDGKVIAGAKVSVICKNLHNQVNFYKVYQTDAKGYAF